MSSNLENQAGPGKPLAIEPPDDDEIEGLVRAGRAKLKDAKISSLSWESKFDLAYNAAHVLCLAALRRKGYRPRNRFIVFQLLPQTLKLGPEVWRILAKCHEIRNLGEYEGSFNIDERLLKDLILAVEKVSEAIG